MKTFIDQRTNTILSHAQIPDDYMIGGALNNAFQSEHVPFSWSVHAINQAKQINIFAVSEEKFIEYRSPMLKQAVNLNPNLIHSSIRAYVEPEEYLKQFAQSIFGAQLEDVAFGDCPSLYNQNLQNSYGILSNLANTVASV